MAITGFAPSSKYTTTIEVNNNQEGQFTQSDDATYDVSASATINGLGGSYRPYDVNPTGTTVDSDGTDSNDYYDTYSVGNAAGLTNDHYVFFRTGGGYDGDSPTIEILVNGSVVASDQRQLFSGDTNSISWSGNLSSGDTVAVNCYIGEGTQDPVEQEWYVEHRTPNASLSVGGVTKE